MRKGQKRNLTEEKEGKTYKEGKKEDKRKKKRKEEDGGKKENTPLEAKNFTL